MKLKLLFRTLPGKFPGAAAHILYSVCGNPAEDALCFLRISPESRKITIPTGADLIGQFYLVCRFKSMDKFQNGNAMSCPQINGLYTGMGCGIFQRFQMSNRQINHVEVIPLAGAVRCGIVAAEDGQLLQLSRSHAPDIWHQVVGNTVGIVSQQAGLVGPNGIEIPQQDRTKSGWAVT